MKSLSSTVLLVAWVSGFANGILNKDVSYEDLEKLNATCKPLNLDNCKSARTVDTLKAYTCHCGSYCSELRTCCIDSPYRRKRPSGPAPSCRNVYGTRENYFLVDKCPSTSSNKWRKLCRREESDDLMSLVPVTSLSSNVTYKNYFCYRCHEREDRYLYWNIRLMADLKTTVRLLHDVLLTYHKDSRSWMAPIGERGTYEPVAIEIKSPDSIRDTLKSCVLNVISKCSRKWLDDDVRRKCDLYTSIIYLKDELGQTVSYKNPHCALCNFKAVQGMSCTTSCTLITLRAPGKNFFSFTHLLDVNRSSGDIVGEIRRCDDDSVWDPFFKKCRILQCAKSGYVVRNGQCIPPQ